MSDPFLNDNNSLPPKRGIIARLRNYLLTGFIVAAPIAATFYIVWMIVQVTDKWFKPWIPTIYNPDNYLPIPLPGIGLIFAIMMLILLGFITINFFGWTFISWGERLLNHMPFVSSVYRTFKQIVETVMAERSTSFQKAVMIEYPRKGIWAIGFEATGAKGEIQRKLGAAENMKSIFLPTTPNPTSGFLLFVKEEDIIYLDMSVEDAARLVISAGLVTPKENTHSTENDEVSSSSTLEDHKSDKS